MNVLRVDIWSDIACPWCWVGKRRLEAALDGFRERDHVEVVWRAFELDPGAPRRPGAEAYVDHLARKYGRSREHAAGMLARMTELGREEGLAFEFDVVKRTNTFDAHRVLHFARERGLQNEMKERLMLATMTEGELLSDHEVLGRLSAEVGLDGAEVLALLASDAGAREVRADEQQARALGITGVPFFVLGERYAVSGAQPSGLLRRALEQAFRELAQPHVLYGEGDACGPDGC